MRESGRTTMAGAETERFDQAFAELHANAKRCCILFFLFGSINVIVTIIALVLSYKAPAMPNWLYILLFVIFLLLFGATIRCAAISTCLANIVIRCRSGARHLLPIHYLAIKPGDGLPGIIENIDKPLLLLPQGPDLHSPEISERDKQAAAIDDALSRAQSFWYHVEARTPTTALISARPLQPVAQETHQPEGV